MADTIIEPIEKKPEKKPDGFDTCIAKAVNKQKIDTSIESSGTALDTIHNPERDFIFYASDDGNINVRVLIDKERETLWLTQKQLAELFDVDKSGISRHVNNIFSDNELNKNSVVAIFATTGNDGKTYRVEHYNLDMILSLGYRINSYKATQFRIWATRTLKEYIIKGFVLDDDRLKQGENLFDKDYFDELLERIRDIRASERRFYQKITDIYKQCSADYDEKSEITRNFYANAQNKLEYAITDMTAAEIVKARANHNLPNMGLTSWKNQKGGGKIYSYDVTIAKNYLTEEEIGNLNRLVSQFLDFAEGFAKREKVMYMKDWSEKLNDFLKLNEYEILENYGEIAKETADKFAKEEYQHFKPIQDKVYKSDFDTLVENTKKAKKNR